MAKAIYSLKHPSPALLVHFVGDVGRAVSPAMIATAIRMARS